MFGLGWFVVDFFEWWCWCFVVFGFVLVVFYVDEWWYVYLLLNDDILVLLLFGDKVCWLVVYYVLCYCFGDFDVVYVGWKDVVGVVGVFVGWV